MYRVIAAVVVVLIIMYIIGSKPNVPKRVCGSASYQEDATPMQDLYPGSSWTSSIANADVDPSVHDNHAAFVKDTKRFDSGPGFTSVADDNTSAVFTNFVGLRRPQHVPIGDDARQQPDIDQSVLARNGRRFLL